MPQHRRPRSLAARIAWRVVFTALALAVPPAMGLLAAGVIWLAAQLPAPRSPDQVICPVPSPTATVR